MTDLMHFAADPVALDRTRIYEQAEPTMFGKPVGFWVSVIGEDDWATWCCDNEFSVERLVVAHHVTLTSTANVLRLGSAGALDEFTERYAVETEWDRRFPWRENWAKWPIDWSAVATRYDGIIVAPYQWSRRNEFDWYYGWDCASGCIWNLSAIASVEPITKRVNA